MGKLRLAAGWGRFRLAAGWGWGQVTHSCGLALSGFRTAAGWH
ncbi:hypothetical protein [Pantoea sp. USHLN298]